jgi:hypothetical protein
MLLNESLSSTVSWLFTTNILLSNMISICKAWYLTYMGACFQPTWVASVSWLQTSLTLFKRKPSSYHFSFVLVNFIFVKIFEILKSFLVLKWLFCLADHSSELANLIHSRRYHFSCFCELIFHFLIHNRIMFIESSIILYVSLILNKLCISYPHRFFVF